MEVFLKGVAVLLLLFGAAYPMGALVNLATRLTNKDAPRLTPVQVGLRLSLIASVPLAGILGGLAVFVPAIWESNMLRILIIAAAAASVGDFIVLALLSRLETSSAGDGSDASSPAPDGPEPSAWNSEEA